MHRRTLLATTTTLASLAGCLDVPGSADTETPTTPTYETLSAPVCLRLENEDDQSHDVTVTIEVNDQQVFDREVAVAAGEAFEQRCFDRAGRYRVAAETEAGANDARTMGEAEPGWVLHVEVESDGTVEVSPPMTR